MSFGGRLKRSAYWANDYLHGKRVRIFYDDLKKVLSDSQEGSKIQKKHLSMLLEHAVNHSPYYVKYKNCKLSEFPVVNKAVLIENFEQVCVPIKEIPGQTGDEDVPCESGELGRIVITDLFNYAFPMIRYDTGDTAIWHEGTSDSNGWVYISRLYGRRLDLVNTKGTPLHPMNFARILKNFQGIVQWQFIQKAEKEYVIRLNLKKKSNLEENIMKELKGIVGIDADIKMELVEEIPVLASGKRKTVICEWKRGI